MAEVLPIALDPLHKSGERRVHTPVCPKHVCRAHAPQGWDSDGTPPPPRPRAHRWCRGGGTAPEQAFPFRDGRRFPLPFTGTQVPPAWRVSSVPVSVPTIAVATTR